VVFLAVTPGLYLSIDPSQYRRIVGSAAVGLFYSTNLMKAFRSHGLLFPQLWSRAEEEQFYLVWPALLIIGYRRPQRLVPFVAAALVFFAGARVVLDLAHAPWEVLISSPATRSDPLMTGCLVALLLRQGRLPPWTGAAVTQLTALVVATLAVVLGASRQGFVFGLIAFELAAAVIVLAAVQGESIIARALEWRPIVFFGLISYSLYLWHRNAWILFPPAVLIAWLSHRYVEKPLRRRFAHPRAMSESQASRAEEAVAVKAGIVSGTA
jgi:peptidoglycan/LPS O-acetylase OafA/YrhL